MKRFKKTISLIAGLSLCVVFGASVLSGCNGENRKYETSSSNYNSYFYNENLYHDQAYTFMEPLQPTAEENVTLRLKAKRGLVETAKIKYSFDISPAAESAMFYTAPMVFECADDNLGYDYWIGIIPANGRYYRYHFEVENRREKVWFDSEGISDEEPTNVSGDWYVLPDFYVPEWSQGAVWYSVMPDSFYNGNTLNDKSGYGIDNVWGSSAHAEKSDYFGGDLMGLLAQMDYMKGLNITSLFINPIWVTAHNAGYGAYDLYQIDSAYGNDMVFFDFVNSLHEEDLKIMCDAVMQYVNVNNIVYNYTGKYPDLYDGKYENLIQYDKYGNASDSGWGGPMVDFSKKIAREYMYSTDESVLISYILKYAIDGWRMDVGNTLSGSDPANWGDSTQILADIRKYIKAAGEDVLFLSEHAVDGQMTNGILDSKWNYAFESAVEEWISGISNANILASSLKTSVLSFPRGVANASYNHLTSHDYQRLYDKVEHDDVAYLAAVLCQMTYVGSPVIYYGEEVGLSRPNEIYSNRKYSFDESMNWDESTWNYYIHNFYSALTELRKEYDETFRNGAFINLYSEFVGNEHDIFAYARYSDKSVITLLNRFNKTVKGFELDVSLMSLANGTVLTDYMTGREYTVNNGKIVVDVYPCGTVLVPGKAGAYRNEFRTVLSAEKGKVVTENDGAYFLSGNGSLASSDDITFVAGKGFNNYELETEIISANGDYALMVRDSESAGSAFYGVKISNGTMTQIYRTTENSAYSTGESVSLSGVTKIKVARTANNTCRVYLNKGDGYEEVNGFSKQMDFDYTVYLGATSLSGSVKLNMQLNGLEEQTGTDFSRGYGSQAILSGDSSSISIENGKLAISGSNNDAFLLTRAHYTDFTQKAAIDYTPSHKGDYAGLTVYQSANNYLVAGRYFDGTNTSLIFGQVINGKLCVYTSCDNPNGMITLQIQKSGKNYTALYSANGASFTEFGTLAVGYSETFAGLVRSGNSALTADYWCFGDSVASSNLANHYGVGEIDFNIRSGLGTIGYDVEDGEWKFVTGGIAQTDKNCENALYNFVAGKLSDFTATFTLNVTEIEGNNANSYVGAAFARSSRTAIDGYSVRLYADGGVKLYSKEGNVLQEGNTSLKANTKLQFTLVVKGDVIALYQGDNPELVLYYAGLEETNGYFGWVSNNATFELYSYNVYEPASNVMISAGEAYVQESTTQEGLVDLELSASSYYNYLTMAEFGISDFAISFNMQINRVNTVYRGYADFGFGVPVGASHLEYGIVVRFNDQGKLSVYVDGESILTNKETVVSDTSSFFVLLTYVNQELKIYLLNCNDSGVYRSEDLALAYTYQDSMIHSGTFTFYSQNAGVRYNVIRAYALSDGTDYKTLDLYKKIYINEPLPGDPEISSEMGSDYRNDFTRNADLESILKYSGSVTVKDGNMIVNGYNPQNWDAGAAVAAGRYENFELTTRVKVDNGDIGGGFVGIEFYKSSATINHQGSALTLVLYHNGRCALFIGNGILSQYEVKGEADADGYYTVHLVVRDGVITFWLNDDSENAVSVSISSLENNSDLTNGYVSLNAGSNIGYFDYVDIKVSD